MQALGVALTRDEVAAALVDGEKVLASTSLSRGLISAGPEGVGRAIFQALKQLQVTDLRRISRLAVASGHAASLLEILLAEPSADEGWVRRLRRLPGELVEDLRFRYWLGRSLELLHKESLLETEMYELDEVWPVAATLARGKRVDALLRIGRDELQSPSGLWQFQTGKPEPLWTMEHPSGMGTLIRNLSLFCGFSGQGARRKFLNLAQYGEPHFLNVFEQRLVHFAAESGFFELDWDYLVPDAKEESDFSSLEKLFDGPRRINTQPVTSRELDIAASIEALIGKFALQVGHTLSHLGLRSVLVHGFEPCVTWAARTLKKEFASLHKVEFEVEPISAIALAQAAAFCASKGITRQEMAGLGLNA